VVPEVAGSDPVNRPILPFLPTYQSLARRDDGILDRS
jgi:hypothetical protein